MCSLSECISGEFRGCWPAELRFTPIWRRYTYFFFEGGFLSATENMELSAEERQIILLIRSMERGELQIIMRNNRPVRAEQILRYPEEDDVYETDGRTEVL